MSLTLGIAIYVILWWTVLFAILPFGVRTQGEDGAVVPGTPESAPSAPRLVRIVLLTTLVSGLLFAVCWAVLRFGLVDFSALVGRDAAGQGPK
jgi:predicted secreted protein